jgi:hypothetical protein
MNGGAVSQNGANGINIGSASADISGGATIASNNADGISVAAGSSLSMSST